MFIVVSRWEPKPEKGDAWKEMAAAARAKVSQVPGVEFMNRFMNEAGQMVVMMGYTDEATYDRLVNDPSGAVAQAMAETDVEEYATWVSSERGESFD